MECVIIPHRKSPSGFAKNYITCNQEFDRLEKEAINLLNEDQVLFALALEFPEEAPGLEVCPEGFEPIRGLVLNDTRGEGALTPVGRPKVLSIDEFMVMKRAEAAFQ